MISMDDIKYVFAKKESQTRQVWYCHFFTGMILSAPLLVSACLGNHVLGLALSTVEFAFVCIGLFSLMRTHNLIEYAQLVSGFCFVVFCLGLFSDKGYVAAIKIAVAVGCYMCLFAFVGFFIYRLFSRIANSKD